MKSIAGLYLFALMAIVACNNNSSPKPENNSTTTSAVDPANDWRFGVALWTFHNVNFPRSLEMADSAGLKYIEPNTFHSAGPELKDSMILQLSPSGIEKLKALIAARGLICESIYIVGDSTVQSWKRQFDIAKQLGVRFVTTEPPLNMWDPIDSLAGVYGMKVAIHEHWKGVSRYWHPDSVLAAIKNHPNFGACADLGHWPKSGVDPVDAVKKLGNHIIGIHFKDIAAFNNPALKDVPTGTGVVNFPAIFQELKNQGFRGNIYIERDSIEPGGNLISAKQELKYYHDEIGKLK
jgi:sugar phosphate isomerase/epimerase